MLPVIPVLAQVILLVLLRVLLLLLLLFLLLLLLSACLPILFAACLLVCPSCLATGGAQNPIKSHSKYLLPYFWGYLNSLVARVPCTFSLLSPTKPAPICITPAIRRLYAQSHPKVAPKYFQSAPKSPQNAPQVVSRCANRYVKPLKFIWKMIDFGKWRQWHQSNPHTPKSNTKVSPECLKVIQSDPQVDPKCSKVTPK